MTAGRIFNAAAVGLGVFALAACSNSAPVSTQNSGSTSATSGGTVVVAAGTDFYGKLQAPIGTKTSHDGDTFTIVGVNTLLHKNAALEGAVISGHLTGITAAGAMRKPAMTIVFDQIKMPDGTTEPIDVQLVNVNAFEPKTHHLRTIGLMIAGAVAGHTVSKSHGGLAGAAAGYVLSQELKTDIAVPAGTIIELKFEKPVTSAS